MLLHYAAPFRSTERLGAGRSLIDISIPEIGIKLIGGKDVTARTPYPNKHYVIPTIKGRQSELGMLIDVGDAPDAMTIITRWGIEAQHIAVHEMAITLEGPRRDVIATNSNLWFCWGHDDWTWEDDAFPSWAPRDTGTMWLDASMDEIPGRIVSVRGSQDEIIDGLVMRRRESLSVTSIGQDRYDYVARTVRKPPMPTRVVNSRS